MKNTNGVTIVGCGLMGPGIATCAALAGHETVLVDISEKLVDKGISCVSRNLAQLRDGGLISAEQAREATDRIIGRQNLEQAVEKAFWVIEAIVEDLASKQRLFSQLDRLTAPEVLLTSNTSGLRITDITRGVAQPARTATTHFWFPGHLIPLVEVVMSENTSNRTADELRTLLERWGKSPVVVKKDLPGQLANRILQAVIREATFIVQSGLASPEDVDTAVKMGMGIRFPAWGPLEHIDAVGLDLALSVQQQVLPGLDNDPDAAPVLKELVRTGRLGHKTGFGFYDWGEKDMQSLAAHRDHFVMKALRILKESPHGNRKRVT